jgi:UDP-N-acetylmuramoyl-tripeptide--D-alanyl-D-alanine ligase
MLRPHAAIITNVEAVHLEYFPNVEAIADAKAEIFTGLDANGTAVLNRDNPHFGRLAAAARARGIGNIWGFGETAGAEGRLIWADVEPSGSVVRAAILGREVKFRLPLPGRHQVQNALAVLLAIVAIGGDLSAGVAALERLTPVKGRGVTIEVAMAGGSFRIVDETYNASPAATRAALAVLGMTVPAAGGRRLVALGDMLELGAGGPAEHAGLAEALIAAKVDQVFTAGPLMRHLHDALPAASRGAHADNSAALAPLVAGAVRNNDIVLVKGSAGSQMSTVVAALRALSPDLSETRRAV